MAQSPAPADPSPTRHGWRTAGFITVGLVAVVAAAVTIMSQGMQLSPRTTNAGSEVTHLTSSSSMVTTTAMVAVTVTASLGIQGVEAPGGIQVTRLVNKGTAARAGIKAKDLLVRVAGAPARTWAELRAVMSRLEPGQRTAVVVLRNGATLSMPVVLDHRPGTT